MGKYRNKVVWIIGYILFCINPLSALKDQSNQLHKVFHHRGAVQDKDLEYSSQIELGKVILYFSQEPIINRLPHSLHTAERKEQTFFLPMTEVKSAECKQMIKKLNAAQGAFYTVHLEMVQTPIKGIKLLISYDPQDVILKYDTFESISLQNGLVFTFYNKKFLEQVKRKGRSVLRITCNKKGINSGLIEVGFLSHEKEAKLF